MGQRVANGSPLFRWLFVVRSCVDQALNYWVGPRHSGALYMLRRNTWAEWRFDFALLYEFFLCNWKHNSLSDVPTCTLMSGGYANIYGFISLSFWLCSKYDLCNYCTKTLLTVATNLTHSRTSNPVCKLGINLAIIASPYKNILYYGSIRASLCTVSKVSLHILYFVIIRTIVKFFRQMLLSLKWQFSRLLLLSHRFPG